MRHVTSMILGVAAGIAGYAGMTHLLIAALHLSLPFGFLYAEISGLRRVSLPWGETIVVARGTPHPLRLFLDLFYLTLFAFFITALIQQYRHGSRRDALALFLAVRDDGRGTEVSVRWPSGRQGDKVRG